MLKKPNPKLIDDLLKNELFSEKLKPDCEKGKVFFAIRGSKIDFYHKGGRVFSFDNKGFRTHFKYAALIPPNIGDYLTEQELAKLEISQDFKSNYKRIKESCGTYSGKEATGVSHIYHRNSFFSAKDFVVLDTEIAFRSVRKGKTQDRIDILLYNKKERILRFVEAKHFTNSEIRSSGSTPRVINQLDAYEKQISKNNSDILKYYTNYIETLNTIFNLSIPAPVIVDKKVTLLIFGFDKDQQQGQLKKHVTSNKVFSGRIVYSKGNEKKLELETLWNKKPIH